MEEKPIIFLNKKREIIHDTNFNQQIKEDTINLNKVIDEAFTNFINGENDKFLSNYQSGRSMLEMLGVLAIVGVLSVGGIAGYSKAIEKFKVNKLLGEYNNLIMGLLEHRDSIINNMPGGMYLGNFVSSANIAPANWKLKGIYLEDSFGNSVYPYVEEYADTNGDKNVLASLSILTVKQLKAQLMFFQKTYARKCSVI